VMYMGKWLFPRKFFMGVVGVALAATAAPVLAQDQDYAQFEITPFYGYMAGGEFESPVTNTDRDLDENNNFGVIFNAAVDEWRHYELLYTSQSTEIDGALPIDLDVQYLQIGGTVSNPDAERVIPYFGITVGAARFSPDQSGLDDETKLAFTVGTGVKVPITEHIGVRFDARAFVALLETDGNIFCVSDNGVGTCAIRTKSDTLFQYHAALGLTVAF
jgi:opacity protein-like surface antigen